MANVISIVSQQLALPLRSCCLPAALLISTFLSLRMCAMKSFDAVLCIIVAASDSPNAMCVRPARVHFDPCSVYSVSGPSPVVLTNNLAARVCGAIVRRHLTIVAAQLADSPNATCVQPVRFRQWTLVTTRHPDLSKAAKSYTGNGFSVSATCSENAKTSTEVLTCPPLNLPA